jgi:hypothetical protein
MKTIALMLLIPFLASACVSAGAYHLGQPVVLSDGSKIEMISAKSKGHSGPDLTVVESYQCREKCERVGGYAAGAPGLAEAALSGAAAAAFIGGGFVGGAAVLRPALTKVNNTVSGGSANAQGTGGGGSCSNGSNC